MYHSVVQVYFPERARSYTYYNDQFQLNPGDIVFVEGKLEGLRGRVTSVSYNFKIKSADYKRVIAKVDISLRGEFQLQNTYMVTFDPFAAPFERMLTFFRAPNSEDVQWLQGNDGKMFSLDTLDGFEIPVDARKSGIDYYLDEKIVYLCVDHGQGHAIVKGSHPYVVEFTYQNGMIGNMTCECFCTDPCKHQYAVILQLQEICKQFKECAECAYFAMITKQLFTSIVLKPHKGTLRLG